MRDAISSNARPKTAARDSSVPGVEVLVEPLPFPSTFCFFNDGLLFLAGILGFDLVIIEGIGGGGGGGGGGTPLETLEFTCKDGESTLDCWLDIGIQYILSISDCGTMNIEVNVTFLSGF